MGIEIYITTDRQQYFPGDVVEGAVRVEVTTKKTEGLPAKRLTLRLTGVARACIPDRSGSNKSSMLVNRDEFLSCNMRNLGWFGEKAPPGGHSFPFAVTLPPDLPPSMKDNKSLSGGCSISYRFVVVMIRPGIRNFNAAAHLAIKVLSRFQEMAPSKPVIVEPETQRVMKWCCFNNGSMSIAFEADRSVVRVNEPVSLTVVARNDSLSSVDYMRVEIVQVCTWYAGGEGKINTRTVASIFVNGSQLGEVQRPVEEGDLRGRSAIAVEAAARANLQELLAAGTGIRYELLVPSDCTLTLHTPFIKVTHMLSVRLQPLTCANSSDVCMPLRVLAGPSEVLGEGSPEANPVELSSVGVMPNAAILEKGSVEEGRRACKRILKMPQSAVKMQFSNKLPQPSAPANGQRNP